MTPGAILFESDDPKQALWTAKALRETGQPVTVTPGIRRLYAVRADWERAYLAWRKGFSAWLLERHGVRP